MNSVVKTLVGALPAIVMTSTLQGEIAANSANPATQPATQPVTAPAVAHAGGSNEPLVIPDGTSLQNPGPSAVFPRRPGGFDDVIIVTGVRG